MIHFIKVILFCNLFLQVGIASASNSITKNIQHKITELIDDSVTGKAIVKFDKPDLLDEIEKFSQEIETISLSYIDKRNSTFEVLIKTKEKDTISVCGTYQKSVSLPTLRFSVPAGHIIQAQDLKRIFVPHSHTLFQKFVKHENDVIGMQTSKNIQSGVPISKLCVTNPILIKAGDQVSIVYAKNSVHIKTLGKALASGALNDMVKVQNISSKKIIIAKVINSDTVLIN
ncbi:flagellar basal body P-ring formation chaperone FlgA [Candidatus Sneabacter namystus]|nr:flagellar basal body P-ring formation chaperone FlgA [Candidatus Sneabacter namystus]